jgi:translation initiation factor 2 alpha subunit (eIF-2alpha)
MLSKSSLWKPVGDMLTEELGRTYDVLRESAHDAALRQAQGKAQFLKEFMDLIAKAAKV